MSKFPYELVGVESKNGKYPFRIVDTKEDFGLSMIHYDVDEIGNTDKEDKSRFLRGTIVSEEKGIIVPSFGYTPTIVCDKFPEDENEILTDKDGKTHTLKDFGLKSVFPMFDGTLLRVWKYKDNIYVSTHRKIDASNSRWGTSGKFVTIC